MTTTQQGYGCLLWTLQGCNFATVPTSLPFKLKLTHDSCTVRWQSRDPWHPLTSHQQMSFGGGQRRFFTPPILVPPCSPDAPWGSSSCSTQIKRTCTPPRRGLQSHLSWARACRVVSSPPLTYCTLLQQPPLGWGYGELGDSVGLGGVSFKVGNNLRSFQKHSHGWRALWGTSTSPESLPPRSCTSKDSRHHWHPQGQLSLIIEITQRNNRAKPISVHLSVQL